MEECGKKTGLTREERLQKAREAVAFQQKLAREGKLGEYLKASREQMEKENPDWDLLVR